MSGETEKTMRNVGGINGYLSDIGTRKCSDWFLHWESFYLSASRI
jgi:hypothetical protein